MNWFNRLNTLRHSALACVGVLFAVTSSAQTPPVAWTHRPIGWTHACAYSPDGKTIAIGGDNGVQFFDAKSQTYIRSLNTSSSSISGIAFSPDGKTLVTGGTTGTGIGVLDLWNVSNGTIIWESNAQLTQLDCVAFSKDSKQIYEGGIYKPTGGSTNTQGLLGIVSASTGKLQSLLATQIEEVQSISASPDGKTLVTSGPSQNALIEFWNLTSQKLIKRSEVTATSIRTTDISPNGALLVCGGMLASSPNHGVLQVWDMKTASLKANLSTSGNAVDCVKFSPNGQTLACGISSVQTNLTGVELWNIGTSKLISNFKQTANFESDAIAFSPDGTTLCSCDMSTSNGVVYDSVDIWSVNKSSISSVLDTEWMGSPHAAVFSSDNKLVAFGGTVTPPGSSSLSGKLTIADSLTGSPLVGISTPYMVNTIHFSPDGTQVVTGGDVFAATGPSQFELWNPSTGKKIRSVTTKATANAAWADFSPDGTILVTSGQHLGPNSTSQGVLEIWDTKSATLRQTLPTHATGGIVATAFAPNGRMLVSIGNNGSSTTPSGVFEAWDATTGNSMLAPFSELMFPKAITFSPDGHTVATAGIRYIANGNYTTGGIELWDMNSLGFIGWLPINNASPEIDAIKFSPDGTKLYATGKATTFIFDVASLTIDQAFPAVYGTAIDVSADDSGLLYTSASVLVGHNLLMNSQVDVFINPSPAPIKVSSVTLGASQVLSGSVILGTVTLESPAPNGGVVVPIWSRNSLATVPMSITIPAGSTTGQFAITTGLATKSTSVTIYAGYGATNKSSVLTINPPSLASVELNPTAVKGGATSALTVKLWAPAPVGGVSVKLASDSSIATIPSTVTVPSGQDSVVVTVTTKAVKQASAATLTAKLGAYTLSAKLTVQ